MVVGHYSMEGRVTKEKYAEWTKKPMKDVERRINSGSLRTVIENGKEFIVLSKHRIEYYSKILKRT